MPQRFRGRPGLRGVASRRGSLSGVRPQCVKDLPRRRQAATPPLKTWALGCERDRLCEEKGWRARAGGYATAPLYRRSAACACRLGGTRAPRDPSVGLVLRVAGRAGGRQRASAPPASRRPERTPTSAASSAAAPASAKRGRRPSPARRRGGRHRQGLSGYGFWAVIGYGYTPILRI